MTTENMAHYRVYRIKGNSYNPAWLKVISETKTGVDRKNWIAFILAWKAYLEGDVNPWVELMKAWKDLGRFTPKERAKISQYWKLPFTPTVETGSGLARSDRRLFEKIKRVLRLRGEGKTCWACGAAMSEEMGLNAHEFWDFDYRRRVRLLTAVRFLCTDCHYLTHQANMMFLPLPDENVIRLSELFCRVNNCKLTEAYTYLTSYLNFSGTLYEVGDTRAWAIDLSKLETILASPNGK